MKTGRTGLGMAAAAAALCVSLLPANARAEDPAPAAPADAVKPVIANLGVASQYIFRGLTQTNGKPALQGGADYTPGSGVYSGIWLSNISWYDDQNAGTVSSPVALSAPSSLGPPYGATGGNSAHLEWDFYGGYRKQLYGDWNYDVGVIHYAYPGRYGNVGAYRKPDTTELYAAIAYKWVSLKYSRGVSRYTFGANESRGSSYADASASVPLFHDTVTLLLHAGRQTYPNTANSEYFGNSGGNNSYYSYNDYKIGISHEWQKITFAAAWTHASTKATAPDGQTTAYFDASGHNIGGSRVAATIARAF